MADTNTSLILTFGYANTNFTRKYTFENISANDLNRIKSKILAVNASLEGGTAGGLNEFFLSDEGDNFTRIVAAQHNTVEETVIPLTEVSDNG